MGEPNDEQKAAMIAFCVRNAGEIKYVPQFNDSGQCTVQEIIRKRAAEIARAA